MLRKVLSTIVVFVCLVSGIYLTACCCSDDDDDNNDNGPNTGLTIEQRLADFEHLVHMVNKYYGPIAWKEEGIGFDILGSASDFQNRIFDTQNDLEFLEIVFDYIANFQDGHTSFSLPSDYRASLDFNVDLYEGKLLVDTIYDQSLPLEIGSEIVTMDGESAEEMIDRFKMYMPSGSDLCTRRWATTLVTHRAQQMLPEITSGDVQILVRNLDGGEKTVTMTWKTSGTPYFSGHYDNPFDQTGASGYDDLRDRLQRIELPQTRRDFLINLYKYGHRAPSFDLPAGFNQRLGSGTDEFFSGTYPAGGKTIGLLRVPKMYVNRSSSLETLATEIVELDQITDGLVIDIMDNPGGEVDFCNYLSRYLHREQFAQVLFALRPTMEILLSIQDALETDMPDEIRAYYEYLYDQIYEAFTTDKTLTDPISLDYNALGLMMEPARDDQGNPIGYSKPIVVLINELSISGGDYFPATIKDSGRATLVGKRTAGGGGHIVGYEYELPYTEASISLTGSLMVRSQSESGSDFPGSFYIENVGVYPHIEYDYQNLDDLLHGGQKYVAFFTEVILEKINE
ncbi:PDZ domain-containing protein [bacterium]|nr:PDZ domain-containing protein [bacterium]